VPRPQFGQVEVVADAGERGQCQVRDPVQQRLGVAEPQREAAADLEVPRRDGIARDVPVHVLHPALELVAVHERRRVDLGAAHRVTATAST
jgi:hypothetical protein